MDPTTLIMIVTLANGETRTSTQEFGTMKACEAMADALLQTGVWNGKILETKCEKSVKPADPPKPQ